MKKKTIIHLAVIVLMLTACNNSSKKNESSNNSSQSFNIDTTQMKSGSMYYQCEMHPSVISDMPGNCPKCGMELIEIKKN